MDEGADDQKDEDPETGLARGVAQKPAQRIGRPMGGQCKKKRGQPDAVDRRKAQHRREERELDQQ